MSTEDDVIAAALADSDTLNIPDDKKLENIASLIRQQAELEDLKTSLEERLKKCNLAIDEVRDRKLPDALLDANIRTLTTDDGLKVTTSRVYFPAVVEADKLEVFQEIVDAGNPGIINTDVIIPFGKGGHTEAQEFMKRMHNVLPEGTTLKEDIHWATFRAFVKEQVEAENPLPAKLKYHGVTRAKITRPKEK